jgi:hypothetical protein
MVKVEAIKDADGVVITFDDEYEAVFSLSAFRSLADRLSELADAPIRHAWSRYFDPLDDDDEPEVGYSERDPYETEDE